MSQVFVNKCSVPTCLTFEEAVQQLIKLFMSSSVVPKLSGKLHTLSQVQIEQQVTICTQYAFSMFIISNLRLAENLDIKSHSFKMC